MTAYGIPVPRGVPKDWRAAAEAPVFAVILQRKYTVPEEWGQPSRCVGWFDRFERRRLIVAHYSNGSSATVRIDANGVWKTVFGEVTPKAAGAQAESSTILKGIGNE